MFSTTPGGTAVYARTAVSGRAPRTSRSPGITATDVHTYRIEWDATEVRYYVDGALVATRPTAIATPMRPVSATSTAAGGSDARVDRPQPVSRLRHLRVPRIRLGQGGHRLDHADRGTRALEDRDIRDPVG